MWVSLKEMLKELGGKKKNFLFNFFKNLGGAKGF
jgi:hypothetical protein